MSPFIIEKTIKGIAGTVQSIKKLKTGQLLIECVRQQQAENLIRTTTFAGEKVKGAAYAPLNRSRGVIRDKQRDFDDLKEEELQKELESQGVTHVKRISIRKNGQTIHTQTYIISFDMPTPPQKLKIGYYSIKVDLFIPNPLRCFKCHKFGHTSNTCKSQVQCCYKCGSNSHSCEECNKEAHCINCEGNHFSSSKSCPIYLKEKEIQKLKTEKRIAYPEARRLYNSLHPSILQTSQLYSTMAKKITKSIAVQTDPIPETSSHKSNNTMSSSLRPSNQTKSSTSKPQVPTKLDKAQNVNTVKTVPAKEKSRKSSKTYYIS